VEQRGEEQEEQQRRGQGRGERRGQEGQRVVLQQVGEQVAGRDEGEAGLLGPEGGAVL